MKKEKADLKKIELKVFHAWIILSCVWCIDFITTAMNLTLFPEKIYEANPIATWFFSFGSIGWVCFFIFVLTIIYFWFFTLWKYTKFHPKAKKIRIWVLGLLVIIELVAITNNILLITNFIN